MPTGGKLNNLDDLLDRIAKAAEGHDKVTLGKIIEEVGSRSFGPLLLLAGVIALSPLSAIPGMPTAMGLFVLLIAGQLLFGRTYFWLPSWLLQRAVKRSKVRLAIRWLRRPARGIDRLLQPRLTHFTRGVSRYLIAILCGAIAICMPVMEVVPIVVHIAGAALTGFALALIAQDGLVSLCAFSLSAMAALTAWLTVAKLS